MSCACRFVGLCWCALGNQIQTLLILVGGAGNSTLSASVKNERALGALICSLVITALVGFIYDFIFFNTAWKAACKCTVFNKNVWSINNLKTFQVISLTWCCPQHTQAMQAADVEVLEAFWRTVTPCNMLGARNSFAARQTPLLKLNAVLALPAANVRLCPNLKSRLGSWTLEPFHLMVLCKRGWKP